MPGDRAIPAAAAALVLGAIGLALAWPGPAAAGWIGLGVGAAAVAWCLIIAARLRRRLDDLQRRIATVAQQAGAPAPPSTGHSPAEIAAVVEAIGRHADEQGREHLKKSRNLESLVDSLDEPVIVTDNADKVLLCNRAAERMVGISAGGLPGRHIREVITSARVLEMHGTARAGATERDQVSFVTGAGPRTYQVTAAPLPPAWGEGTFGAVLTLRDVTELAQAAAMRTGFVANASHELRTPVAAIRAAVETLESADPGDADLRARLLGMIGSHTQRLEEMTRDLMELSRLESPEMPVRCEAVDWRGIEATLRETFDSALRARRLELAVTATDPRLGDARSDSQVLLLILRNLVDNATKYAHEGTTIAVRATVVEAPGAGGSPRLRVEVTDRGVGVPLELQDRVFERFFQVDPARTGTGTAAPRSARRGTGLGLSIVKHAAKALGGHAGLESVWGKKTTVWVESPLVVGSDRAG